MKKQLTEWTLKGFLQHFRFVHEKMPDHRFAWVLGAGASRQSEIPTGAELAATWLRELHLRFDASGESLEKWATAENLDIPGFEYSSFSTFYPQIFERRFRDHVEEGFAYLECMMAGREPSPGYSILAKAMEETRHRVAITTNFDNLISDSLSIYTDALPFVCGHEALTPFVRSAMRRPIVCKIHRDLLLGPKNDSRSLKRLHEAWSATLRVILEQHTPIFVGYGGNDDSLMDLLESLSPGEIRAQLVWCYYNQGRPSDRIKELVRQHNGALVPVPDFDSLLVLLGQQMGLQPLDLLLGQRASKRVERYRERLVRLDIKKNIELAAALADTYERYGGWFTWEMKARAEAGLEQREFIYKSALEVLPGSVEIRIEYARLLWQHLRRPDDAERFLEENLELAPDSGAAALALGEFLWRRKRNLIRAEELLRRACDLGCSAGLFKLAYFVAGERDSSDADALIKSFVDSDPNSAMTAWIYAHYMTYLRGRSEDAESHLRAFMHRSGSRPVSALIGLARAIGVRDPEECAVLLQEALSAEPNNPNVHHGLALHLWRVEINLRACEKHFRASLEIEQDRDVQANFVAFLLGSERFAEAQAELARATEPPAFEQSAAELQLYAVVMDAINHQELAPRLVEMRRMFEGGFPRSLWPFDEVLAVARSRLSEEGYLFVEALSKAVTCRGAYDELKTHPWWLALPIATVPPESCDRLNSASESTAWDYKQERRAPK